MTPQYVHGITADRELPMIKRIAIGSLRNKLLFILPAALLLSQFVPWLVTPILMLGATYLCYEGAEKVLGWFTGHDAHAAPTAAVGEDAEKQMTAGAIRTDFILSAEIMVIALNEVADRDVLAAVRDPRRGRVRHHRGRLRRGRADREDGRHRPEPRAALVEVRAEGRPRPGRRDAQTAVGTVDIGTVAMLWVGGHILLLGTDTLGWHTPYGFVHHLEELVHDAVARRSAACWRGWSTPRRQPSSDWSSAPSSWRSCTCCRSARRSTRPEKHADSHWSGLHHAQW